MGGWQSRRQSQTHYYHKGLKNASFLRSRGTEHSCSTLYQEFAEAVKRFYNLRAVVNRLKRIPHARSNAICTRLPTYDFSTTSNSRTFMHCCMSSRQLAFTGYLGLANVMLINAHACGHRSACSTPMFAGKVVQDQHN